MIDAKEFLFALPEKANPDVLEGLSTLFHFDVTNSGQYTVEVAGGKITVSEGFHGTPKCTVKTSAEHFSQLIERKLNPQMAVFTGKLKVSNLSEIINYAKIFGLM